MIKRNGRNERVKRRYLQFLKDVKGRDEGSLDAVAKAIDRFEEHSKHRDFKKFHVEQARAFKAQPSTTRNARTGEPLSASTIHSTLAALKTFFAWLSNTISYSQSASITQMLTLRGIVGAPVGSFLPYVTGGLGVGWDRFSQTVQVPSIPGPCVCWSGQSSRPQTGWVVGAGIEYAISAGVSVKTEYLYSDLGSLKFATFGAPNGFPGLDLTHSARFTNQTVKVGLNFRL